MEWNKIKGRERIFTSSSCSESGFAQGKYSPLVEASA